MNMNLKKLIYSSLILTVIVPLSIYAHKNHRKRAQPVYQNKPRTNPMPKRTQEDLNKALLSAIRDGNEEMVETLLANGADVKVQNNYGNTASIYAAGNGNKNISRNPLSQKPRS